METNSNHEAQELDEIQRELGDVRNSLSEDDEDDRVDDDQRSHITDASTHSAVIASDQNQAGPSSAVMASENHDLGQLQARKRLGSTDRSASDPGGRPIKRARHNNRAEDTLSLKADEQGLMSLGVPSSSKEDVCNDPLPIDHDVNDSRLNAPLSVQYDEIDLPSISLQVKPDSGDFSSEEKRISQEILANVNVGLVDPKIPYMKWTCSDSTANFINKVFRNPMLEAHTKLVNLKTRLPDVDAMSWQNVDQYFLAAYKDPVSGRNSAQLNRVLAEDAKFRQMSRQFVDAMGPVALVLDTINSGTALSYGQIALALKRSLALCGTATANINKQRRSNMLDGLNLRASFGHLTKKPPQAQAGTSLFGEAFLGQVKTQHEATKAFTSIVRQARPKQDQTSRPHTASRAPSTTFRTTTPASGNARFPYTPDHQPFRDRSDMKYQRHSHGGQGTDVATPSAENKPASTQFPRDKYRGRGFSHSQGNRNK